MIPNAVMIFAAGFGTRMMPLTADRPKPMVHVAGAPMIDRAIGMAKEVAAGTIAANTHYKPDVLETHLAANGVTAIREEPDILDTGGGLKNAAGVLGAGPVWTINPDAIWLGPNPLTFALTHWRPGDMDTLLVCVPPENAQGSDNSGDFIAGPDGQLSWGAGVIYGGVQIVKMSLLTDIREEAFSLHRVWNDCIRRNRLFGCNYPGEWCDIGHPAGLKLAEDMIGRTEC